MATAESDFPDADIEVTEEFLREREEFFTFCIFSLLKATLQTPGAFDSDVRDALAALIKTLRTAESGLVYETRSENAVAAGIQSRFSAFLTAYQREREESERVKPSRLGRLKDSDLLAILVLLRRLAQQNNNGRPRGRMFLDALSQMTPGVGVDERAPSIIL